MKQRCSQPTHPSWRYYGGAGVKVCTRWVGSFDLFLADMGAAPEGHWIDRIDNTKGYEPGNVRWVTPRESGLNRRKAKRNINPDSIRQRSIAAGIPYEVVRKRIAWGWQQEQALRVGVMNVGRPKGADLERLLSESIRVLS